MRVITSLIKGLDILEFIGTNKDGTKVSNVAKHFGTPTSNITLFLNSLIQKGYVIKCELNGKYYISEKIVRLSENISTGSYSRLSNIATKHVEELQKEINEDALIGVLNGFNLQFIKRIRAENNIQIKTQEDQTFSPHVAAGGKAIIAFFPQKKIDEYFKIASLERFTDKTITSKSKLENELEKVRELGYATNRGEWENDIMAVAAPIFVGGIVTASLVIQFPTYRHSEDELVTNAQIIIDVARKISEELEEN